MARPYVVADSFGGLEQAQLARDSARDQRFFNSLRQRLAERQQLNQEMAQRAAVANDLARLKAATVAQSRDDQRRADQQAVGTALALAELGDKRAGREDYQKQLEFQNQLAEKRFGLEQEGAQLAQLQAAKYLAQPSRQELEQQMLGQEQEQLGVAASGLAERLNELNRLSSMKLAIPETADDLQREINLKQSEIEQAEDIGPVSHGLRAIADTAINIPTYPFRKVAGGEFTRKSQTFSRENEAEKALANEYLQLLPPELQQRGLGVKDVVKRLRSYLDQQEALLLPEIEGLQRSGVQTYITRDPATGAYVALPPTAGSSPSATGSLRSAITGRSPLNALPQAGDRKEQDGKFYIYNGLEWLPEERLGQPLTR